jgi:hypothetical protein
MLRSYLIIIFIFLLSIANISLSRAQSISVPSINEIEKTSDCEKYTLEVKNIINWLINNRFDEDTLTRKQARGFLITWLRKNEKIQVKPYGNILAPVLGVKNKTYNEELMVSYLAGMTLYALDYPDSAFSISIQRKGIETIIEVFNRNKDLLDGSDKLSKYKTLIEEGELDRWIYKNILHKKN